MGVWGHKRCTICKCVILLGFASQLALLLYFYSPGRYERIKARDEEVVNVRVGKTQKDTLPAEQVVQIVTQTINPENEATKGLSRSLPVQTHSKSKGVDISSKNEAVVNIPKNKPVTNAEIVDHVPHIIHQTYRSAMIPNAYKDCIKSCLKQNPKWTYMFWTDEDGLRLVRENYPQYIDLLKRYEHYGYHRLLRADALRYFILYHYGGVYLDMDFDCLKPFDKVLDFGSCVLSQEVPVQSFMIYKIPSLISNAIIVAKSRHPFFRYVIDNLGRFMTPGQQVVIRMTGPIALQNMLDDYKKKPCKSAGTRACEVTVIDTQYLLPTADKVEYPKMLKFVERTCSKNEQTESERNVCAWSNKTQFHLKNNTIPAKAFTNHLWMHLEYSKLSNGGRTLIDTIVTESLHRPASRYGRG